MGNDSVIMPLDSPGGSNLQWGAVWDLLCLEPLILFITMIINIDRRVRSSQRRRPNRSNALLASITTQPAVTHLRVDGQGTSADRKWTVPDGAEQLARHARRLYNGSEWAATLEL